MNSFTRNDVATLRKDIDAALQQVALQHGIIISLGNCRFTPNEARFSKLTIIPKTTSNTVSVTPALSDTIEGRQYIDLAYMFALPKDGLGKTFISNGRTFKITGLKANRRKYPVQGVSVTTGRAFKFTADQVRRGLGL
jgi:hypothetical protein